MLEANSQRGDTNVLFDEFVREALVILFAATLAMVWAWTVLVALFDAERTSAGYGALALVAGSGLLLHRLAAHHLRQAVVIYLLCLLIVISLVVAAYRNPGLLMLYLPVILIAAALTDQRGLWVTPLVVLTAVCMSVYYRRATWRPAAGAVFAVGYCLDCLVEHTPALYRPGLGAGYGRPRATQCRGGAHPSL